MKNEPTNKEPIITKFGILFYIIVAWICGILTGWGFRGLL